MNYLHSFFESFYQRTALPAKLSVWLSFCLLVIFTQFTLLLYKSLIMVVEIFQKYHWIQHTNTQPVVITWNRNKLLWMSEASEFLFNWHIHFLCIQIFNNRRRKFPKNTIEFSIKDRNPLLQRSSQSIEPSKLEIYPE